jgi:DNA replication and repair protein RecF
MLRLNNITLTYFKNYEIANFEFSKKVVGICGLNGMGKTNLLDAIFYTCFTKSYFTNTDAQLIKFNEDGFRLEANFKKQTEPLHITAVFKGAGKKEFSANKIPYQKMAMHVGQLPLVIVAPDDIEIITGSSENRRRYLDNVLCQLDQTYLQQLITYNKVLQQRNSLLKQFALQKKVDINLLEIINDQLIEPANFLYQKRIIYTQQLVPLIEKFYKLIADNEEVIAFNYQSQLSTSSMGDLLTQNFEKDKILQRTSAGIHKDDVVFLLQANNFKTIASQGQRKSLLFALKLAQYELLQNFYGYCPLLLLDDVFEKLDEKRTTKLLNWVCQQKDGQVFITDTHKQRLIDIFEALKIDGQIIAL